MVPGISSCNPFSLSRNLSILYSTRYGFKCPTRCAKNSTSYSTWEVDWFYPFSTCPVRRLGEYILSIRWCIAQSWGKVTRRARRLIMGWGVTADNWTMVSRLSLLTAVFGRVTSSFTLVGAENLPNSSCSRRYPGHLWRFADASRWLNQLIGWQWICIMSVRNCVKLVQ